MDVLAALHDPVDLDLRFQWRPDWFLQTLNEPPFVCVSTPILRGDGTDGRTAMRRSFVSLPMKVVVAFGRDGESGNYRRTRR